MEFIQVPCLIKFFATISAAQIAGNRVNQQIINLQKDFATLTGFLDIKAFIAKKELAIYFDKEYHLKKAIEFDITKNKVITSCFVIANSKQTRIAVADCSIRITNIPLDTKSDIISYFFAKYRKIVKFSMNTYEI